MFSTNKGKISLNNLCILCKNHAKRKAIRALKRSVVAVVEMSKPKNKLKR